jgi:hypothetical protein
MLCASVAIADPPKRRISWWHAMEAWQGRTEEVQRPVVKEDDSNRRVSAWRHVKPPKPPKQPCSLACQANFGEAINYPPYDVEP